MKYQPIKYVTEDIRQNIWDTVILEDKNQYLMLFQQPIGSTTRVCRNEEIVLATKTYSETNLDMQGCSAYKDISFSAISVDIFPSKYHPEAEKEIELIKRFGIFGFQIVDKRIFLCPISLLQLPSVKDVLDYMDSISKHPELMSTFGDARLLDMFDKIIDKSTFNFSNVIIKANQCFKAEITLPPMKLSIPYIVKTTLHGCIRRPI